MDGEQQSTRGWGEKGGRERKGGEREEKEEQREREIKRERGGEGEREREREKGVAELPFVSHLCAPETGNRSNTN